MRKKVLWITETAVMLALLVTLQALTKPMGQLVTGSKIRQLDAAPIFARAMKCIWCEAPISNLLF